MVDKPIQPIQETGMPDTKQGTRPPRHPIIGEVYRNWNPTDAYLTATDFYDDTSYAAGLVAIMTAPDTEPRIPLVLNNPDDPTKFSQYKGDSYRREIGWKPPIGKFFPFRYVDDRGNATFDASLFDTTIEEWFEEIGIDFRDEKGLDTGRAEMMLEGLRHAPVFNYCKKSFRQPSIFHIDRIHFWVTPHNLEPDKNVWKKQIELLNVRVFPLFELPHNEMFEIEDKKGERKTVMATTFYSHVARIVDFLEHPNSADILFAAGISKDAGERIRARFSEYKIPRRNSF